MKCVMLEANFSNEKTEKLMKIHTSETNA